MNAFTTIYRVLGNDLPPRHKVGQTLENLNFILKNEMKFKDCTKKWIINRIYNTKTEQNIISLLQDYNQEYIRIPFCYDEYHDFIKHFLVKYNNKIETNIAGRHAKILYLMNINGAKNIAIEDGAKFSNWILPLDGNCFFTRKGWNMIDSRLRNEPGFDKIFVIPMFRLTNNNQAHTFNRNKFPEHEPQVIFGKFSNVKFNEQYRYGLINKIELFQRLGFKMEGQEQGVVVKESSIKCGFVLRLYSGVKEGEKSVSTRCQLRENAIDNMINLVDSHTGG